MSRRLAGVAVTDTPHRLDAPALVLDERMRTLLAQREASAEARGREAGRQEAEAAAAEAARQATDAVGRALQEARQAWERLDLRRRDEVVDVARALAAAVLAREPGPAGTVVLERVAEVAAGLDHGPFTIMVGPTDHDMVIRHLDALPPGCRVVADPDLQPGEARITGPWSRADLTRDALLALAAGMLAEVGP